MKGYFISFGARKSVGVNKKIDMQIQQLSTVASVEEINAEIRSEGFFRDALSVLPFISLPCDYTEAYQKIQNPDFIILRREGGDRKYIQFLKYIKTHFPDCKIIVEIATYPCTSHTLQRIDGWALLPKDLYNQRKLKKYVDRVLTYCDEEFIFGIPTIRTMNGIIVDNIKPIHETYDKKDNVIRLLAVALFQKAHGYERCIKGLAQYYQNNNDRIIELHMVGEGSELSYYKRLVLKCNLEKYVFFYGKKVGDELDAIYEKTDIALGCFGLYKVKINKSSALKVREYLAKGLPVVSGCREDAIKKGGEKYFCIFPNNKSTVDMSQIVEFYDNIYCDLKSRDTIHSEIRKYAEKNLDMSVVMKPVIDYLRENKE